MSNEGENEMEKLETDNKNNNNNNKIPASQQLKRNSDFFAGEEDSSPSPYAGNDDFVWPELPSSSEIPNDNIVHFTMYSIESIPSTSESTSNGAVSVPTDQVKILGFEKKLKDSDVVVVSSDNEDELSEEDSEEVKVDEEFRAKLAGKASKSNSTAMECLIEVLKQLYVSDEKGNGENVDILETVKRRGMTFPKPRGYDSLNPSIRD